ncbi:unnamed protein product, partial [Didymodactylos carnosus]
MLITGDSLIKYLKFSDINVAVLPFPGLTTERLNGLLRNNPKARDIIHQDVFTQMFKQHNEYVIVVGTNNLANEKPSDVIEKVIDLVVLIKNFNSFAMIALVKVP